MHGRLRGLISFTGYQVGADDLDESMLVRRHARGIEEVGDSMLRRRLRVFVSVARHTLILVRQLANAMYGLSLSDKLGISGILVSVLLRKAPTNNVFVRELEFASLVRNSGLSSLIDED